jgi:hypothetical protein
MALLFNQTMRKQLQLTGSLAIALSAGAMDSTTGLLLFFSPLFTLDLMGIEIAVDSLVYMRFIGAFVFAVGSLYLWAVLALRVFGIWGAVCSVFYATAWVRMVICLCLSVLILSKALAPGWAIVAVADGGLAGIQLFWILRGGIPRND